jgi:deoxyuridine 5'-triphosphate nucleotidohydrolase
VVTPNYEVMKLLVKDLVKELSQSSEGVVTITINASCSAPASKSYNDSLSARRIESAIQFFTSNAELKKYLGKSLIVQPGSALGEVTTSQPKATTAVNGVYDPNSNNIKIKYDNIENILKIANYINIPYNIDIINNYIIYDSGCNSLDFLGKIYNNYNHLCIKFYKSLLRKTVNCKVFKTDKNAILPSKSRESDVGYDLTIIKEVKKFNDKTILYDTGIKIEVEDYYYSKIVPRSSLSKSGYMLANSIGIIDNSYRGNLLIALTKVDEKSPDIELPFKCCQLIIEKQIYLDLYEVDDDFNDTDRKSGGFGSTDSI